MDASENTFDPAIKLKDYKFITCVLQNGVALEVMHALKEDKDINTASFHKARGYSKVPGSKRSGSSGQVSEKDVLSVTVPSDRADEIFEFIYDVAKIDHPHGGIIIMAPLQFSVPFTLPDVSEASKPLGADGGP